MERCDSVKSNTSIRFKAPFRRLGLLVACAIVGTLGLGTTGSAAAAPTGRTTPAVQSVGKAANTASIDALACTLLRVGGATLVRLYWCDGTQGTGRGYHGQAYLAGGGSVWLVSGAGTPTAFTFGGASGWFNTSTVGDFGAPWKACKHDSPITSPTDCTSYATI
jgi:hypothetical protein